MSTVSAGRGAGMGAHGALPADASDHAARRLAVGARVIEIAGHHSACAANPSLGARGSVRDKTSYTNTNVFEHTWQSRVARSGGSCRRCKVHAAARDEFPVSACSGG